MSLTHDNRMIGPRYRGVLWLARSDARAYGPGSDRRVRVSVRDRPI